MADNLETSNIIVTDGQGNQQLAQATANQSGSMIWSDGIKTGWCVVQDGQGNKQLAMKVFDLNGGGGGVAENWASVLETMEDLSTTVNTKTTLDLADLLAMDIDGRPSHKEAGATVYSTSNNTIGIIDSVTSTQAVVTTVYVGGSGGSSIQVSTMPTASALLLNKIVEYVGATDENYHNAYFYKCVNTEGATATVTFNPAKISVSGTNFINFMKSVQPEAFVNVVSGTMTYYTAADLWAFDGKNADNEVIVHYQQYTDNWEAIGFTFTGTFTDEEVVNFTSTITVSYSWKQVNVQPQGDSLPSQTGHNGKYLKTDGTNASWASVDALPSQSGQSGKYLTTDGSSASWASADSILSTSSTNAVQNGIVTTELNKKLEDKAADSTSLTIDKNGQSTSNTSSVIISPTVSSANRGTAQTIVGYNAGGTGANITCIGYNAQAGSQPGGVAIGSSSHSVSGGTAIGHYASANNGVSIGDSVASVNSIAIGKSYDSTYKTQANGYKSIALGICDQTNDKCVASAQEAIQLGLGENSTVKQFQVYSYPMLDGTTGLIPVERLRTTIANTTDTTATIDSIAPRTDYTFSQPLTALTITAVTANIMNEATLTFTADSTGCTVTLPASGLTQLGAPVTLGTANCKYTISFWNNFYIVGIVEP